MVLGDVNAYLERFDRTTDLTLYADLPFSNETTVIEYDDLRAQFCDLKLLSRALESVEIEVNI